MMLQRSLILLGILVFSVAMLFAFSGFKAQLYQLELKRTLAYWQAHINKLTPPTQAQRAAIDRAVEGIDQSWLPQSPDAMAMKGRVFLWYGYFAQQQGNEADAEVWFDLAQKAHLTQAQLVPNWPYAYLLALEVEIARAHYSPELRDLWQNSFNFAQQHAQTQFALAQLVPGLWYRLTQTQKKQAFTVFYDAAIRSPQQAKVLFKLNLPPELRLASCLLAKSEQHLKPYCSPPLKN